MNNVWITCSHVPGKVNLLADVASRKFNDKHEWKLNEDIFKELYEHFGVSSIDLFASILNKQMPRFCSWKLDQEAEHFDAFPICWSQFELIYAFPPFALIARCLQKIRAEMAKGWLIVQQWPSQPWIGTLLTLFVKGLRLITRRKNVLCQPSGAEEHLMLKHTRLMAGLLSGNSYETEAFQQQARTSLWLPGDPQLRNNIDHTSPGGYSFVINGTSIPLLPL